MIIHRRLDWLLPSWLENVDAFSQSINADLTDIAYTVIANVLLLAVCLLVITVLRQTHPEWYIPKRHVAPERTPSRPISNATWFGWIVDVVYLSDELLLEKGGYDAYFLVRFCRLCAKILAFSSIFSLLVLLPVDGFNQSSTSITSFDRWSMTNISQGSSLCWLHLLGIYILTAITIYYIEQEFIVYAKLRHDYLRETSAHLRTVLVEGIPHKLRSPMVLRAYLEHLYPGSVLHIRLGVNIRYLQKLIDQRTGVLDKLEHAMYAQHEKGVHPTVKLDEMAHAVDAIRYYSQRLDEMNEVIAAEQDRILTAIGLKSNSDDQDLIRNTSISDFLRVTGIRNSSKSKTIRRSRKSSKRQPSTVTTATLSTVDLFDRAKGRSESFSSSISEQESDSDSETLRKSSQSTASSYQSGMKDSAWITDATIAAKYESFAQSTIQANDEAKLIRDEDFANFLVAHEADSDSDNDEDAYTYTLTVQQFLLRMWHSHSLSECWYTFRQGRKIDEYVPIDKQGDGDRRRESDDDDDALEDLEAEKRRLISTLADQRLFLSKAFVTFKTFTAATTARQVLHMQMAGRLAFSEAPEPTTDLNWNNLYVTRKTTIFRRYLVETIVVFLIVVWVAPVTLMSYVFSYDAIISAIPAFASAAESSALFASLLSIIQPFMIVALMNLLPPLLTALATFEGCIALSVNQFRSFDRYFAFQVVNVFLVIAIAGSVIDCVTDIYEDPASAFSLLGSSLPKVGGFFMSYILFKAFTGLGLELLRFANICLYGIKLLVTKNITPRDLKSLPLGGGLRDMLNPGWFPYNKILAQDALVFVMCATYICIAPFTGLAGTIYFIMAQTVYKHQMIYVYESMYEKGGKWWPVMARCCVVALLFAQATMVGMMILKETYTEIYFLALLFAGTLGYYWHVSSIYIPLANQLPLDMAVSMDKDSSIVNNQSDLHDANDYLQPSLRAGAERPMVDFDDSPNVPI